MRRPINATAIAADLTDGPTPEAPGPEVMTDVRELEIAAVARPPTALGSPKAPGPTGGEPPRFIRGSTFDRVMWNGVRAVRRYHDRFDAWVRGRDPVTYRDAWRYSLLHALIFAVFAVTYFVLGSEIWPTFVGLILPTMAAFTFGFALRRGTTRQRLFSLAVGLAAVSGMFIVGRVRNSVAAIGPPAILLAWLLILIGLFGYAYPDYATIGEPNEADEAGRSD